MSNDSHAIQHIGSLQKLDEVIQHKYPYCTPDQVVTLRERVLEYVMRSFSNGYDLAFIKREGDQAILKILRLVEEES